MAATHMQNFRSPMLGLVPAGAALPAASAAEPASVLQEWANVVPPGPPQGEAVRVDLSKTALLSIPRGRGTCR